MSRILNVKEQAVTRGVLDKNVRHEPDVIEITFLDSAGVPHTIFPHRQGPFTDPEKAVEAWERGELHGAAEEREVPQEPHPPAGPVLGTDYQPPLTQ